MITAALSEAANDRAGELRRDANEAVPPAGTAEHQRSQRATNVSVGTRKKQLAETSKPFKNADSRQNKQLATTVHASPLRRACWGCCQLEN